MNIEQIAKVAGVSTATVSRVLNDSPLVRGKTADRVRAVIADLHYLPNRSARVMRRGESNLFGVIVSDISNPFFPELLLHFEDSCAERGYDAIFANTRYDPKRLLHCLQRMFERDVDGIAIFTSEIDPEVEAVLLRRGTPVVTLSYGPSRTMHHVLQVEYDAGMTAAVHHLVSLGHRKIAIIAGPQHLWTARRRLEIFQRVMVNENLSLPSHWILQGDFQAHGGQAAAHKLLNSKRSLPTAILCSNDMTAIGAMTAFQHAGLNIPGDISIVGFDDLEIVSSWLPSLSTIRIPRQQIAQEAFRILLNVQSKDVAARHIVSVETSFVPRESTGPAAVRHGKNKRTIEAL